MFGEVTVSKKMGLILPLIRCPVLKPDLDEAMILRHQLAQDVPLRIRIRCILCGDIGNVPVEPRSTQTRGSPIANQSATKSTVGHHQQWMCVADIPFLAICAPL